MNLISIKCFKFYYFFFGYWALDLITSIIDFYKDNNIYKKNDTFKQQYNYLNLIIMNISDLLAGILVLITKYRIKSEKEENKVKINNDKYELIYNDLSIKKIKIFIFL